MVEHWRKRGETAPLERIAGSSRSRRSIIRISAECREREMLCPFSIWKMEGVGGTFLKATSRKDMGRPRHGCLAERSVPAGFGLAPKERPHSMALSNRGCTSPSSRRETARCPPSNTHIGSRRYHRLLLHSCPVWLSALVLAGCMITSQSLVENSQQPGTSAGLIKPVIQDEANDSPGASDSMSSPAVHPKQQEIASPMSPDQRASSVSQQADISSRANPQSNAVPRQSTESLESGAQPTPGGQGLLASRVPGGNASPDLPHTDSSVRAGLQAGASAGQQTPAARRSDGGPESKPVRAPEAPARSGEKPYPTPELGAKSVTKETTQSTHVTSSVKEARHKSHETQWEDQKVKQAAMELRDAHRSAQKMKLCYAVKDDEWWVIFYEDAASHYELRQYVWDRDRERLDPFLVMKRIPRDRLSQDLSTSEPDRACEVVDLASPPQQEENGLNANF